MIAGVYCIESLMCIAQLNSILSANIELTFKGQRYWLSEEEGVHKNERGVTIGYHGVWVGCVAKFYLIQLLWCF